MKYWKIPKAIIILFLLYLALIFFFAFNYHRLYQKNCDSFIIQSQYFEKELKIIDSLQNINVERLLKEENNKLNIDLGWLRKTLRIYNTILNDFIELSKRQEGEIPPLISFDKPDRYTRSNGKYPDWIRSTATREHTFYPKFESPNFRYSLSITDHIDNLRRPDLRNKLNVHLQFSYKINSDSTVQDRFKYYVSSTTIPVKVFHSDIIKLRTAELRRSIMNKEKQLKEIAENLEKLRKKGKNSSLVLGFGDFFYFSTNIQTTGDLIDILPNIKSVRTWIAAQRILSVIVVALVFTYYLGSRKEQGAKEAD